VVVVGATVVVVVGATVVGGWAAEVVVVMGGRAVVVVVAGTVVVVGAGVVEGPPTAKTCSCPPLDTDGKVTDTSVLAELTGTVAANTYTGTTGPDRGLRLAMVSALVNPGSKASWAPPPNAQSGIVSANEVLVPSL
jgi:hypothetical protein